MGTASTAKIKGKMSIPTIAGRPMQGLKPASSPGLAASCLSRLWDSIGTEMIWDRTTYFALLTLFGLWVARMYATWATWGSLTIDCGREMYVPAVLSEGKMLYRDVWYTYGPAAPYFNSYLFRWFGLNLNVLYWAGSISALACALLLFFIGGQFSSRLAGWTAAVIVLIQAFNPGIFCFPLPYSFASVYGCLTACLFLWLVIRATRSPHRMWLFLAGTVAAAALILKLEFGAACYATLSLLIAVHWVQQRSWKAVLRDLLAILPGVAACGAVVWWVVSIRGVEFITQENLMGWPTSYFVKTYGKMWLASTGLTIDGKAIGLATIRTMVLVLIGVRFFRILRGTRHNPSFIFGAAALIAVALAFVARFLPAPAEDIFRWIFFPQDTALYVGIAGAGLCWYLWRNPSSRQAPALAMLLGFSALLAARILLGMKPSGYSIYYNGPVILSFVLLAPVLFPREYMLSARRLICVGFLSAATLHSATLPRVRDLVPLVTERGIIRVSKNVAENYQTAIAFMKDNAAHSQPVLSIPEDTSLYFLSETHCPIRVLSFTPGTLSPGKMTDEVIREIELAQVRYLIWSNRVFPEYGVPTFGSDYDRTLGNYFRSHYHFVRPLSPTAPFWDWTAGIWERKADPESQ